MKQNHKTLAANEPWYRRLRRNRSTQSIKYDGTKITITEGLNLTAKTLSFTEVVGVEIDVGPSAETKPKHPVHQVRRDEDYDHRILTNGLTESSPTA